MSYFAKMSWSHDLSALRAITGPQSSYGTNGKQSVKVDDIVVTFKNPSVSSNGTSVNGGQFFKIFLSKR